MTCIPVMDKDIKPAIIESQEMWTIYNELIQAMEEAELIVK